MKLDKSVFAVLLFGLFLNPASAADFDGSVPLICATVEARDCVLGDECFSGNPADLGAPHFIRVNFKKKLMIGEQITSPILTMAQQGSQLIMQGTELDFGWSFALQQSSGRFSVSLTNSEGAFLLYGSCTPE